jgi:hypothetical protein
MQFLKQNRNMRRNAHRTCGSARRTRLRLSRAAVYAFYTGISRKQNGQADAAFVNRPTIHPAYRSPARS